MDYRGDIGTAVTGHHGNVMNSSNHSTQARMMKLSIQCVWQAVTIILLLFFKSRVQNTMLLGSSLDWVSAGSHSKP